MCVVQNSNCGSCRHSIVFHLRPPFISVMLVLSVSYLSRPGATVSHTHHESYLSALMCRSPCTVYAFITTLYTRVIFRTLDQGATLS